MPSDLSRTLTAGPKVGTSPDNSPNPHTVDGTPSPRVSVSLTIRHPIPRVRRPTPSVEGFHLCRPSSTVPAVVPHILLSRVETAAEGKKKILWSPTARTTLGRTFPDPWSSPRSGRPGLPERVQFYDRLFIDSTSSFLLSSSPGKLRSTENP